LLKMACAQQINAKFKSAVIEGDYERSQRCLNLGANPNARGSDGRTLLHMCATCDTDDDSEFDDGEWNARVDVAFKSGCDITIQDANGMTALDILEKQTQSARDSLEDSDDYEMYLAIGGSYCYEIEECWQFWKRREKYMRSKARRTGEAARHLCDQSEQRRRVVKGQERSRDRSLMKQFRSLNPNLR